MSDNEIMKALECCGRLKGQDCDTCPLTELQLSECTAKVAAKSLDLINRLQAEKEALINGQETLQKHIAEQKSEISILKDSNINLQELYYAERVKVGKAKQKVMDACKMLKTAKSEAIKEFAERLKESAFDCDVSFGYGKEHYTEAVAVIEIDNLVKEMVGGQE